MKLLIDTEGVPSLYSEWRAYIVQHTDIGAAGCRIFIARASYLIELPFVTSFSCITSGKNSKVNIDFLGGKMTLERCRLMKAKLVEDD